MPHSIPDGYSVRRLTDAADINRAAALVGGTRTESEAGSFDLAGSIATYERQFRWLARHERGGVYGVFKAGTLVGAAGLAPLTMLKNQYDGLTDDTSRKKQAASESGIAEYERLASQRAGKPVTRDRIALFFGLGVLPSERSKGLARVLLAERLPRAAEQYDHVLTSTVNPKVERLLEEHGFLRVAEKPIGGKPFRVYHKALHES